jgi:hypothetical protein
VTLLGGGDLLLIVLDLALLVLAGWAFVDCLRQPAAAFPAAGKLTKPAWLGITGVCVLLCLVGLASILGLLGIVVAVASIVYLVDVRPAVSGMRPGSGPYG